jgi:hypothetical protein
VLADFIDNFTHTLPAPAWFALLMKLCFAAELDSEPCIYAICMQMYSCRHDIQADAPASLSASAKSPALAAHMPQHPFPHFILTWCCIATLRSASSSHRPLQLAPAVVPHHRRQQPVPQQALWLPPARQGLGGLEHGHWQLVCHGGQVPTQVGELCSGRCWHAGMLHAPGACW